jgi:two-component system, chemotaxis family, sensor kinase CheA
MSRSRNEELMRELQLTFQAEAAEHLQTITQSLLQLERQSANGQDQKSLQDAFRAAHSLKGAARAVSLPDIEKLAHALENILQEARDNGLTLDADTCDVLYDTTDSIQRILDGKTVAIEQIMGRLNGINGKNGGNVPAPLPTQTITETDTPVAVAGEKTIRVSVNKLDDLMAQVGELLVAKISARQRQSDFHSIRNQFQNWDRTWREITTLSSHINGTMGQQLSEALAHHSEQVKTLMQSLNGHGQNIKSDEMRLDMVTTDLQDQVRRIRMLPFQTIALGLERAVRDAAHTEGKQVLFSIEGGDTELDKKVLETLKDPLLHLLRNAVNHGIEAPDVRQQVDKLEGGRVTLTIRQRGNEVHITVSDDGNGFDLESLQQAIQQRHNSGENGSVSESDLISMAFLPGISTAKMVTELSGRGVGLDVVRQQLETIHGRISVDNHPGQGASIKLVVPTSLVVTRGLMVRSGRERYVLPLLTIEKITEPADTFVARGKPMMTVDGKPLPLVRLAAVLEQSILDDEKTSKPMVVIISIADQRLGLLVDDVLTEQELAIKPLGQPLQRVRNVAGAALMGNGQPIVVLNPADLIKSALNTSFQTMPIASDDSPQPSVKARILVVDDSITTRTLEKNILEAAGFYVITAIDGIEALKRLDESHVDVVVSDIEMPNMNGFELAEHLRESNDYKHLPIILVTSLESQENKERGMLAGADAYIVKRGFDQAELLATIQSYL